MAKASKKRFGPASQGKKAGTGGTTDLPSDLIGENMVLSNRDKARHSGERGLDSKSIETEQYQDHAANRQHDEKGGK